MLVTEHPKLPRITLPVPPVGPELSLLTERVAQSFRNGVDGCIVRRGKPTASWEVCSLNRFAFQGHRNDLRPTLHAFLRGAGKAEQLSHPQIKAALARIELGAHLIARLHGTDEIICKMHRRDDPIANYPHVDCKAHDLKSPDIEARIVFGAAGTVMFRNDQVITTNIRTYMIGLFCAQARAHRRESPEVLSGISEREREDIHQIASDWASPQTRLPILRPGARPSQLGWGDIGLIRTGVIGGTVHAAPSHDGRYGEVPAPRQADDTSLVVQIACPRTPLLKEFMPVELR